MNKRALNMRTEELALQIHRGFLSKEISGEMSDIQVLAQIPEDGLSFKRISEEHGIMVLKPLTRKAIRKAVKKQPNITAFEILTHAGFIHK